MTSEQFAALYERRVDMVYRLCFARLGSAPEAEDATQEVFLKCLRSAPDFTDEEHEKRWFIRAAINHCIDVARGQKGRQVPLDQVAEPASGEEGPDFTLDVVRQMGPPHSEVVYLYYYEGYKTQEIAEMLGYPPSTVRSYLSEARARLKQALGGGK